MGCACLNKAVIQDKNPLPTVEELTAKFYGSSMLSKLDLFQGYLQVPLHPSSRNLTAFVSHVGFFSLHPHAFWPQPPAASRKSWPPSSLAFQEWSSTWMTK